VPGGGGDHSSRSATFAARERERNGVELCLRGATFEQIGRQLNIERSTAYKAWQRALKRLPNADVETLRKAQSERLQRMRGKLWTEIAGRADPSNLSKVIAPNPFLDTNASTHAPTGHGGLHRPDRDNTSSDGGRRDPEDSAMADHLIRQGRGRDERRLSATPKAIWGEER
jgi:hypothetical protein